MVLLLNFMWSVFPGFVVVDDDLSAFDTRSSLTGTTQTRSVNQFQSRIQRQAKRNRPIGRPSEAEGAR